MTTIQKKLPEYKSAIRKFPSEILLAYLYEIIEKKEHSIANQIYESYIQKYIIRSALPFFVAQISQDTMLYSNPHRTLKESKCKDYLYTVFKTAKEFYIDTMGINISNDDIYNASSLMLRIGDTQSPYYEIPAKIGRAIILFLKLPSKIKGFDFNQEFFHHFKVSIEDFIKSSLLIFSLTRNGYFGKNFINSDKKLILPEKDAIVTTLHILAADPDKFRNIHQSLEPEDKSFYNHKFNPIRIKPILQPNRRYNKYIAPVHFLIASQCPEIIYYNMLRIYSGNKGNVFTEWFGKLLESYIHYIFRNHIVMKNDFILTENDIESLGYKNKEKSDFIYIDQNRKCAILIECKAARRYRGAVQSGYENQLFGITSKHIEKAYEQLEGFAQNIKQRRVNINELKGVNKIYGIIITWEDLFVFNAPAVKNNRLPLSENCDYIHTLSLSKLELLIDKLNINFTLIDFIIKLANSNDADNELYQLVSRNSPNFFTDEINNLINRLRKK